ncbi:MAG: hypothetical protein K2M94_07355 [Paramuribaculum sp.]|nr:hypothetical protein [Paramuribaculum sp.]
MKLAYKLLLVLLTLVATAEVTAAESIHCIIDAVETSPVTGFMLSFVATVAVPAVNAGFFRRK